MCVCMHSHFVENHSIRILEDGPLISEVVLSQRRPLKPGVAGAEERGRRRSMPHEEWEGAQHAVGIRTARAGRPRAARHAHMRARSGQNRATAADRRALATVQCGVGRERADH
jgi:hypothetical protein